MKPSPILTLHTALGSIQIEIHSTVAPTTASYVLGLVEAGIFDGASFYRTTRLGDQAREPLIQGGPLAPLFSSSPGSVPELHLLTSVETTSSTGLHHQRGTVSLARDLFNTGHVLPELFICLDDYPELDAGARTEPDSLGFPAFACVRTGLEVVAAIAAQKADAVSPLPHMNDEILVSPVLIDQAVISDALYDEPTDTIIHDPENY